MQVWRLVAHHEKTEEALNRMKEMGRIAIGWSDIGDLADLDPGSSGDIAASMKRVRPDATNAMMAGPSLWNLYREVEVGDHVIVTANGKRACVFEVTGSYIFDQNHSIVGYSHQRAAILTGIDPEKLWLASDKSFAEGENLRWTLARCKNTKKAISVVHREGKRYSVISTAIERDPRAREECLKHFGFSCQVCDTNFEKMYGSIGKEYIHVHHRIDLAHRDGEYEINPIKDLVPLCPNCHAMVHTDKPAMSVSKLKSRYQQAMKKS